MASGNLSKLELDGMRGAAISYRDLICG